MTAFVWILAALWVWAGIYTASYAVYCFKQRDVQSGVNMLLCIFAGSVLCVIYLIKAVT